MTHELSCDLVLPKAFKAGAILSFHARDSQEVAEQVRASSLRKGLTWNGQPAQLRMTLQSGLAQVRLAIDGLVAKGEAARLEVMARRMLGLTQAVEAFESRHRHHPELGVLIKRQRGLRVPVTASVFEALTWAITGQQISVPAAVALRRKLIMATGVRHSQGLLCYPDADQVARLPIATLRQAGFSTSKAETLLSLSEAVASGALPLTAWTQADPLPVDDIRAKLMALRGIGPWTVNYTLLRGFAWLDGSLHGDVAVRRGLQTLLNEADKPVERQTEAWLAAFSPWRALVAAHLWAMQSAASY